MKSESSSTVILSIDSSRSSCVLTAITDSLVLLGSGATSAAGLGFLVTNLAERVAEVPDRGREQRRHRCRRRLDRAREAGQQDLAWGQRRQPRDAIRVDA